jgi:hypothetical protein
MSVIELVRFVDALRRFFSGDVTEGLGLSDTLLDKKNVYPVLQDTLNLDPDVNRSMVFRVVAPESFAIDDVDALKLIFAPTLSDVVDIAAAYISPGNSITTWAVNAKTGAVSEYQSFDFNSFARVGNTYVAANSTGLYELAGDTDDGDDIISTIRSGFMQLAGSNFTALRDAYLGMRGDGTYILRVITGDGNTYNYSFAADSMRSSKVPLGKGMRARYIAFELVNAGDDFDLDAVEFIPLASKRRV